MLLVLTVIVLQEQKPLLVERVVYSSEDLIVVRKALQHVFLQQEQLPVSTSEGIFQLHAYATIERFRDGVLLTYEQPIRLPAFYDGLVVFTGHTKYTGKTMTVLYSEGTTVTYGFLTELLFLPYTPLRAQQGLSNQQSSLYIQIEQNGKILDVEQVRTWLKEYHL